MSIFPLPVDESIRSQALARYEVLDTEPEPSFDRITALAAELFAMPITLVSLVDDKRLWFKSRQGMCLTEIARDQSFCAYAVMGDEVFVVSDATLDTRFASHPLVTGDSHLRFYAGAPLKTTDGHNLGVLVLIDTQPRQFDADEAASLVDLAKMVVETLEARRINTQLTKEISERRQVEETLRVNEERLRLAIDTARQGTWDWNMQTGEVHWSPEHNAMYGLPVDQRLGSYEEWLAAVHPADREAAARNLQAATDSRQDYIDEVRALHSDGSVRWISVHGRAYYDVSGKPLRMLGLVRDITIRRVTEHRLRMLESSVDHANDAIVITEAEPVSAPGPRIIYVNQAFTTATGYSAEEVYGKTPRLLQGPGTSDEAKNTIRRALKRWKPVRVELLNYRKDGTEFWVELNIVPVADETGWYTHWVSVQRDVTERKRIENALQQACMEAEQAARRVSTVLESISDAFFSVDHQWRFTYVNNQAERLLRRSRTELLGRSGWEEFPEVVGGVFDREHRAAVARGESVHYETFFAPLEVWLEIHVYPSSEGVSVYLQDISARRRAQKALEDNHHLLKSVIDGTDNIVFTKDRSSRYTMINPAGASILHRPIEEVVGQDDEAFFSAEDATAIRATDQEILRSDRAATYESTNLIDGTEHVFVSTKSPYRDAAGNLLGLIGIVRDITEQRDAARAERVAKEEAEEANRAKSEFLSRMSHELRTPLNAILGFGQLLQMNDLRPQETESVDHILKAGRHLLGLIDEVLMISRIEAGNLGLSVEPVSVPQIAAECLALVGPQASARGLHCYNTVALPDPGQGDLHVLADRQKLRQILLNLLSNAVKYNQPRGTIKLACRLAPSADVKAPARLRLEVEDTGPGLHPEEIARLFTPFERLQADRSPVEGTGLGLAVSRALVEAMQGPLG